MKQAFLVLQMLFVSSAFAQENILYPFPRNGKWGYINHKGQEIVAPNYETASKFVDGKGRISVFDDRGDHVYGFVNAQGKVIIPPKFVFASDFKSGLAKVSIRNKYAYLLEDGTIASQPVYDEIYPVVNGVSIFKKNGLYGYASNKGKEIILPAFVEAFHFYDDRALVKTEGRHSYYGYIDKSGNYIISPEFSKAKSFTNGLAAVSIKGRHWKLIDINGNDVSKNTFDEIGVCGNGLIPVRHGNLWGYIDRAGNQVIPFSFKQADQFSHGLAIVSDGQYYGYINTNGEQITPYIFTRVTRFDGTLARVSQNNKNGFMNSQGRYNLSDKITSIGSFYHGRARMQANGVYGYYNKNAKIAVPPIYIFASQFEGDLALTVKPSKNGYIIAYINQSGQTVYDWYVNYKPIPENNDLMQVISYPSVPFYKESHPDSKVVIRINYGDSVKKLFQQMATPIVGHGMSGLLFLSQYLSIKGFLFSEAVSMFPTPMIDMGIYSYFRERFGVVSESRSPYDFSGPLFATFMNGATLNRTINKSLVTDNYFIPFMKVGESFFLFTAAIGYPSSEYPTKAVTLPNFLTKSTEARFSGRRDSKDIPETFTINYGRERISVHKNGYGIQLTHSYSAPVMYYPIPTVDPVFVTSERFIEPTVQKNQIILQTNQFDVQTNLQVQQEIITNTNEIISDEIISEKTNENDI